MRKIVLGIVAVGLCLTSMSVYADVYSVDIDQDAEVTSGTQWAGENKSNQGIHPEIEPIRANDSYDTKRVVYLGFNLLSNADLREALLQGEKITSYKLYAYNLRNFAMGDAVIGDVIIKIYYVNNDNWWEGPYHDWTIINSSNPLDGITYDNQVGYNDYLVAENEDGANKWYSWEFQANAFSLGGINDNPDYLSLAMVPNSLNKSTSWWLVSSFASKENLSNPSPYLEVYTSLPPVAEAGKDIIAKAGEIVSLDASGSYDPDGTIVSYEWILISDPENPVIAEGEVVDIIAHGYAEEMIMLRVIDDGGGTATDRMMIINPGIQGPQGEPGVTPEELTELRNIVDAIADFPPIKEWLRRRR